MIVMTFPSSLAVHGKPQSAPCIGSRSDLVTWSSKVRSDLARAPVKASLLRSGSYGDTSPPAGLTQVYIL